MKINGEQLAKICEVMNLSPVVPGMPGSAFILFEDTEDGTVLKLHSLVSTQVMLPGNVGLPKKRTIDRRVLFPFIQASGEYELEGQGENLVIKHGKRKAEIPTVQLGDWTYDKWFLDGAKKLTLTDEMIKLAQCGRLCASDDPILPELTGVYLEFQKSVRVFASNDIAMLFGSSNLDQEWTERIVMPLSLIDVLAQKNVTELIVRETLIGAQIDGVYVWAQATDASWRKFPVGKLKKLVQEARKAIPVLSCKTKELARVCSLFVGYMANILSQEWCLYLQTRKTGVTVEARTPYAKYSDQIEAQVKKEMQLSLNLAVLEPVVRFLDLDGKTEQVDIALVGPVVYIKTGRYEFLFSQRE